MDPPPLLKYADDGRAEGGSLILYMQNYPYWDKKNNIVWDYLSDPFSNGNWGARIYKNENGELFRLKTSYRIFNVRKGKTEYSSVGLIADAECIKCNEIETFIRPYVYVPPIYRPVEVPRSDIYTSKYFSDPIPGCLWYNYHAFEFDKNSNAWVVSEKAHEYTCEIISIIKEFRSKNINK